MVLPAVDDLVSGLAREPGPGRVLLAGRLDGIAVPSWVELVDLDRAPAPSRSWAVVLVAEDRLDLRATALPRLGRTRTVVLVLRHGRAPVPLTPLPTWPALLATDAYVDGEGAVTVARFEAPAPAHEVYGVLAAAAGDDPAVRGPRGLVVGFVRGQGQPVPPADPAYLEINPDTRIADLVVPPDVVLSATPLRLDESPVTGRVPVVLDAREDVGPLDEGVLVASVRTRAGSVDLPAGPLSQALLDAVGDAESVRVPAGSDLRVLAGLAMTGVRLVGPDLDPRVVDPGEARRAFSSYAWRRNLAERAGLDLLFAPGPGHGAWTSSPPGAVPVSPIGFDPVPTGPEVALSTVDPTTPLAGLVPGLRAAAGVRLEGSGDAALVRDLALAGVPLVTDRPLTPELRAALGDGAADAIEGSIDLSDTQAREEHSIVLRRAAWHARGVPDGAVSVLLATRRPEMLDHALAQVARQRGADVELVLATHGYQADPGRVRERLEGRPFRLVACPADLLFGRVLAAAAEVASGDRLLKMDDDDWYGPDVVADLVQARAYSSAPVVGSAAEYVYLTDHDVTVRQHFPSEKFTNFVAGGMLMVDAALLRQVGGFRPVRRFVDAQLLAAVRAVGAPIYRSHGLGYVLRRNPSGHTWQVATDDLIEEGATRSPGFAPSRLLEYAGPV
jgi:hypothetical protein